MAIGCDHARHSNRKVFATVLEEFKAHPRFSLTSSLPSGTVCFYDAKRDFQSHEFFQNVLDIVVNFEI